MWQPNSCTDQPELVILEQGQIRSVMLDGREAWTLGRFDPTRAEVPELCLTSRLVSREHGWFMNTGGEWYFTDNPGNRNGTYHNGSKITRPRPGRKRSVLLSDGDVLRIDGDDPLSPRPDGAVMLFTLQGGGGRWRGYFLGDRSLVRIGRDAGADLVVPDPCIDPVQAQIIRLNGEYRLTDCAENGQTWHNGEALRDSAVLRERDWIGVGIRRFYFLGNWLVYSG